MHRPELLAAVYELRGLDLLCWCAPERCHGDVLLELARAEAPFASGGTTGRRSHLAADARRCLNGDLDALLCPATDAGPGLGEAPS
jgi:uncharacterized protein DUF4326